MITKTEHSASCRQHDAQGGRTRRSPLVSPGWQWARRRFQCNSRARWRAVGPDELGERGEARSGTETWRIVACTSIVISIVTDRATMAIEPWPSMFSQKPEGSDEEKTSAEFIWLRVKRRRQTKSSEWSG